MLLSQLSFACKIDAVSACSGSGQASVSARREEAG